MGNSSVQTTTPLAQILRVGALLLVSPLWLQACGNDQAAVDEAAASLETQSADGLANADKLSWLQRASRRIRNKAPTISGTPATQVLSGLTYGFVPSASDSNGDAIVFSIANMPAWASFNTQTGALTGTPTSNQVGTTSNIIISASDGRAKSSLPGFNITVVNPAPPPAAEPPVAPPTPTTHNATVSWSAPTTNVDGTQLADLAGFKVYYGLAAQALDHVVQIGSPATTSQALQNLTSGTWYFAVAAVNTAGLESQLSSLATRTFP